MRKPRQSPGWYALAKRRLEIGRANHEPCCLCGGAIDYGQTGRAAFGPTIEHLVPVALGGSVIVPIDQLGMAHKHCQDRQGGRLATTRGPVAPQKPKPLKVAPTPLAEPSRGIMAPPRYFSDRHPDAADTLGPMWRKWLEAELGFVFRPWQIEVFDRALEIDDDGNLCWREVIVSTPRQSGKSYLIYAIAMARSQHSDYFGEPQECLHVANNIMASLRIHQKSWRWAKDEGLRVYKVRGSERVVWPDGSEWALASMSSIWGRSASLALVDEGWNVPLDVVDSALAPTQVERNQPQMWLFSTANENPTALMLLHRKKAIAGAPGMMIAEWSADPKADPRDPATWKSAAPHWSHAREQAMRRDVETSHFPEQWLNIWPSANPQAAWSERWLNLPLGNAQPGGIAAVEVAFDRSCYGVACASTTPEGETSISASVVTTQAEALAWLRHKQPTVLMVGANLVDRFQGPWIMKACTVRQTRLASPWLKAEVIAGNLRHDHDSNVNIQMSNAVLVEGEEGVTISARRSQGAIPAITAIAWAGAASSEDRFGMSREAAVW